MAHMSPLFRRKAAPHERVVTLIRKSGCHLCDDAERVIEKVCTAADMRSIIAVGGRYEYLWFDKNGDAIGSLMVDHCA